MSAYSLIYTEILGGCLTTTPVTQGESHAKPAQKSHSDPVLPTESESSQPPRSQSRDIRSSSTAETARKQKQRSRKLNGSPVTRTSK